MKKAIKINLGGMVFHIDEDAYDKLKTYLGLIEEYFAKKDGGKEIIADIESRMAELFQVKLSEGRQVIIDSDVEEVIKIMGDPLELDDEEINDRNSHKASRAAKQANRRLYRDPENSVLGGVCGGLAAYFGIDPSVMRIIFLILLLFGHGITFMIYIILWIAIPKALTVSQKLEMRGEYVNVSNIERSIREEINDVRANFRRIQHSDGMRKTTGAIGEIFNIFGKILIIFIKIIVVILGIALIFAGLIILLAFIGLFFFKGEMLSPGIFNGDMVFLPDILSYFVSPAIFTLTIIALVLFIAIPLIAMIYGGLRLIFNFRARIKTIGVLFTLLWILSFGTLFILALVEGSRFANKEKIELVSEISIEDQTVFIRLEEGAYTDLTRIISIDDEKYRVYIDKDEKRFYGSPKLYIMAGSNENVELEVRKEAFGPSRDAARRNTTNIKYTWRQEGNVLYLRPYFDSGNLGKWEFAEVNLNLRVPEGHKIVVEEGLEDILFSVSDISKRRLWTIPGKTLKVSESGIHVVSDSF